MRKYGFIWATLALFVLALAGHWWLSWKAYVEEARAHEEPVRVGAYLVEAGRDTLENWQSEFLQLVWQVWGLTFLLCVGSSQSKESDERIEAKLDFLMARIEGGDAKRAELDRQYQRQ